MKKHPLYGIDLDQAVSARAAQRDSRTLGQRLAAAGRDPNGLGIACFVLAGIAWCVPALVDLSALGGLAIGFWAWRLRPVLPFKLPATYRGLDPHEREPGTRMPRAARGLLFLGNDRTTNEELYLTDDDLRTHLLVLGGTGAGKTEAMTSLAANTLLWGSGFTYVDGKGDASLWTKVQAMARACGREDDVYVLNYLTGSADVDLGIPGAARLSNTFNPFLYGSTDAITQLLIAQMAEAGGDSATWKDKAIGLLTAYVRALVAMRDRGHDEQNRPFTLDVGALRAYLPLDNLIDLYLRARDQVEGFALPGPALESLRTYLESVPGFQDPAHLLAQQRQTLTPAMIGARAYPPQPDPQTYLQHGYLQNQFSRLFGQLADVYGHIFRVGEGEIDLTDIILQRRILVVMLPALEKSPDELASLGKLLVGALKTMLAIGLGARLEGSHLEVIDRRPVAAPAPYLGVFDEYGYYAVRGFAVVPAQARSLGFSICFGGQDLQSFGKESQEEAAAIVANTLTKVGMFVEDPKDTMDLFEKLGGQALAVQSSGLTQSDNALLAGFYRSAPNAVYERRARIDPLDLRAQHTGEAHVLRGTTIVRANLFFAGVFRAAAYRINRFIALGATDASNPPAALTPESVRAAVASIVATPLEPWQGLALPALLAEWEQTAEATSEGATTGTEQTFAHRLIDGYLQWHAELDAAFAAQFRAFAGHATAAGAAQPVEPAAVKEAVQEEPTAAGDPAPAVGTPTTESPAPAASSAEIEAAVEAIIADQTRRDPPAGVEASQIETDERDFDDAGFLAQPGEPSATRQRTAVALSAAPSASAPDTVPDAIPTPEPPPVARPRRRAVLPLVAVDRLEELTALDFSVFYLDVREIHPDVEREETVNG